MSACKRATDSGWWHFGMYSSLELYHWPQLPPTWTPHQIIGGRLWEGTNKLLRRRALEIWCSFQVAELAEIMSKEADPPCALASFFAKLHNALWSRQKRALKLELSSNRSGTARTFVRYREGCSQLSKTPCACGHRSSRGQVPLCNTGCKVVAV